MDSAVADGPRSVILEQVSNGIAIRMAVMSLCLGTQNRRGQAVQDEGGGSVG
jgi:aspartate carbamoyltransferase catalytic subunit